MAEYKDAPLSSRPKTLDPAEYFNLSPEYRRAEEERASLRAQLKRDYQLQLNDPHRRAVVEDPALTRWTYARSHVYPHFRPTTKTSLAGAVFAVLPVVFGYFFLKKNRDNREEQIKAGKYDSRFQLSY
ncbi:hypothetical protein AGOR_G00024150 [Albula goreensis]|uniref:NADH dehydrogenase [ubiquinone] 1 beta subcomplex subunit 4 n=1 Tax=Albula goreensis TaxID=1534307 RepID=A0A8T3E192_9TELE|nr:hypothetical protein AGOR_G00024150 [Albula goreensis]